MPNHKVTPRKAAIRILDAIERIGHNRAVISMYGLGALVERTRLFDSFIRDLTRQLNKRGWVMIPTDEGFGFMSTNWLDISDLILDGYRFTSFELMSILNYDSPTLDSADE